MSETTPRAHNPDFMAGRLFEVVNTLEEGFAVLDAAGVVQFMNPAVARVFSVDPDEILGWPLVEFPWEIQSADGEPLPKEEHPSVLALTEGVATTPRVLGVTAPTIEGTVWLEVTARPLFAADGSTVEGSVALFRDISARRTAEQALEMSEQRFQTLTELVPVGIFQTDVGGQCTYVNEACCQIAGFTVAEALGDGWTQALHPDDRDRVWQEWQAAAVSGAGFRSEYRFLHADGDVRWVIGTAIVHRGPDGQPAGFIGSLTDVTDQKAAAMMKDQLIGLVSHELRAPLVAIGGALGHLEPQAAELDEHGKRLYEVAVRNTRLLERLVRDLLEIERLEGGVAKLELESISVGDLMQSAVELIEAVQSGQGAVLHVLGCDPALRVEADHDRLIQVLSNLLANAVKFSGPETQVTVEAELDRAEVVFVVRDQGRGIPDDHTDSIFERFVQIDTGDAADHRGVGLGLAIARAIVTRHGGRIWVESTPGMGSAFYFTIPVAEPAS